MSPNAITFRLTIDGKPVNVISASHHPSQPKTVQLSVGLGRPERTLIVPKHWFHHERCPILVSGTRIVKLFR